jgi:uncharacterized protein YndB with AHSA1/START domain
MTTNTASTSAIAAECEVTFTRTFDAPRALVFKAWTEPERLAQWWGPRHFTNPVCELDARPGGTIRVDMRGPDGTIYPMGGTFHEVIEPERLVFTTTALNNASGTPQLKVQNVVTFSEQNGKTTIVLRATVVRATDEATGAVAGMEQGWSQSLERLTVLLQNFACAPEADTKDREITAMRIFNAPRELVFKLWTDPEHIVHWWGPAGFKNTIFEMDVRPGGRWRHIMHGPDGVDYKNESIYREVVEPERLVYEHLSGPAFVSTVTFEDQGNKTKVSVQMLFETVELRRKTVEVFNAVEGLKQTLQRLADQLDLRRT